LNQITRQNEGLSLKRSFTLKIAVEWVSLCLHARKGQWWIDFDVELDMTQSFT